MCGPSHGTSFLLASAATHRCVQSVTDANVVVSLVTGEVGAERTVLSFRRAAVESRPCALAEARLVGGSVVEAAAATSPAELVVNGVSSCRHLDRGKRAFVRTVLRAHPKVQLASGGARARVSVVCLGRENFAS